MPRHALASALAELEALMVRTVHAEGATTLAPVLDAFFDLSEEGTLSRLSEPAAATVTMPIVAAAAGQALGRTLPWVGGARRVRGLGFVHGSLMASRAHLVFFWFDARQQGVMAIYEEGAAETHMVRLTLTHPGPEGFAHS